MITEERREKLIADCKKEIVQIESLLSLNKGSQGLSSSLLSDFLKSRLQRQQIALASLEAKPKGYDTTCEPWFEYAYPAPPVPILNLPEEAIASDSPEWYRADNAISWAFGFNAGIEAVKRLNEEKL